MSPTLAVVDEDGRDLTRDLRHVLWDVTGHNSIGLCIWLYLRLEPL